MSEDTNKSKSHAKSGAGHSTFINYTQGPNNTWIENRFESYSPTRLAWTDTFTGTKNPNWKAQIKAVTSATTPASGRRVLVLATPLTHSVSFLSQTPPPNTDEHPYLKFSAFDTRLISSEYRVNGSFNQVESKTAENQAISKLYSILQGFEQASQSGEDLGEWKQTRDAIKKPLPQVRQLLEKALNGHANALKRPNPRAIVSGLADTWLEWVYGWKPLANSIADAMVGVQNRDNFAYYYPFQATGASTANASGVSGTIGQSAAISFLNGWSRDESQVRYHGVWESRVDVPKKQVNDVLGLNVQNIIPTIWNLIPYSFLIDYFTNVGDFLNITAVPWTGVRWCAKTVRNTCYTKISSGPVPLKQSIGPNAIMRSQGYSPGSLEVYDTRFSRTVVTSLPVPRFEVNLSISNGKALNVVALLASRLKPLEALTKSVVGKYPGIEKQANALLKRTREDRSPYPFHRGLK